MFELKRFHEDLETLHVGTCEPRSYYMPQSKNGRSVIDLDGEWRLLAAPRYEKLPADWMNNDGLNFDTVSVPSTLQILGYDCEQYTNVRFAIPYDPPYVPDENPAFAYVRDFELTGEDVDARLFLNFEGVDSCMYVWLNGKFVGYSQVSHSTSEFEITGGAVEGQNRLCVLVLKWCDGTYLEDQDKFRMSGIFRDVYILRRAKNHIRDFRVETVSIEDDATIKVSTQGYEGVINYSLSYGAEVISAGEFCAETEIKVNNPKLWNAEEPNLYTLRLETDGEIIEKQVGIREVSMRDGVLYLNGVKIKLHGVNRHDSNAYTGYTISREQVIEDMKLMKLHNINAIRTSHYPNSPWFTELCNEYGFYVIGESDIECHGVVELAGGGYEQFGLIARDERFKKAIIDRVSRNVHRDINNPSIIIWSLGNESGYGVCFEAAGRFVKELDPTRLLQYESSIHAWHEKNAENGEWIRMDDRDLSALDFMSRMYASTQEVINYCESEEGKKKAFIQCEYCHAMGNGPGDLEDYQALMDKYDNFSGGFIWEWCDHGIYMGKTDDGEEKFFYGGDFGEKTHDGNFCMDGLIYPDRTAHTGLLELKNVWRPIRAELLGAYDGQAAIEFVNKYNFKSTDNIEIVYEAVADDVLCSGVLDVPVIGPGERAQIIISCDYPADVDTHILIRYKTKDSEVFLPKSYELGFDELIIQKTEERAVLELTTDAPKASFEEGLLTITGEDFTYVFSKDSLTFTSLKGEDGSELLLSPMEWNIHRAPTDNDIQIKGKWFYQLGFDRTFMKCYEFNTFATEDAVYIRARGALTAVAIRPLYVLDLEVKIDGLGMITFSVDGVRGENLPYFPRFGLKFMVNKDMNKVHYIGYGPNESYVDKHRSSYYSAFETTVEAMYEPYIRPQENGHRFGCTQMSVSDGAGKKIEVVADCFEFNASPYTTHELMRAAHRWELNKAPGNEICIDYKMSGVGSNSCGPELLPEYRFDEPQFSWTFTLIV